MFFLQFVLVAVISVAGQMTATWRTNVVAEHNTARNTLAIPAATNMITLVYDMSIEAVAQGYLDTAYPNGCSGGYAHNPNRGNLGENWYSGKPANDTGDAGATAAWTTWAIMTNPYAGKKCSERDNFYSANGCPQAPCYNADGSFNSSWNTGHFTQVMWATTASIGCGYKSGCGTTCNYSPPGNWNMPRGLLKPTDVWQVASGSSSSTISSSSKSSSTSSSSTSSSSKSSSSSISSSSSKSSSSVSTSSSSTSSSLTGTLPGVTCYSTNDARFAGLTPTTTFTTKSACGKVLASNCQVCGPTNVTQVGSTLVTIGVNITCTTAAGYISYGMPSFISITGWTGNANIPTMTTLTSTAQFQMKGNANVAPGNVRAEWCINRQYYAAFPVILTHQN